jgi:hypothetical protein
MFLLQYQFIDDFGAKVVDTAVRLAPMRVPRRSADLSRSPSLRRSMTMNKSANISLGIAGLVVLLGALGCRNDVDTGGDADGPDSPSPKTA